jgi:hypothetical protein
MNLSSKEPTNWSYATKPTRWTVFFRTFPPWQAWRFVRLNMKMIRIIGLSHKGQEK